jgi:hypothetical protein
MNQEEVGLAFDSGSNCTIVTKEYAVRKKLKKIGPVISFGSLDTEMADLYQLPLWASGKRRIKVNAVSVVAICNGPPARCPMTPHGSSCNPEEHLSGTGTCTSLGESLTSVLTWITHSSSQSIWSRK